jgi:hypothetical protein
LNAARQEGTVIFKVAMRQVFRLGKDFLDFFINGVFSLFLSSFYYNPFKLGFG